MNNCLTPKIKNSKPYNPKSKLKTPAPSAYNLDKENLSGSGAYFNSKYSATKSRSFSKSHKYDETFYKMKKKIPGPGAYPYFSEFGSK